MHSSSRGQGQCNGTLQQSPRESCMEVHGVYHTIGNAGVATAESIEKASPCRAIVGVVSDC